MSTHPSTARVSVWQRRLLALAPLFALALAAGALFFAWKADRGATLVVSDQVSPGEATALLERANDAVNFTDSVLSFLEGASVVLGAFIALGAWMLRNSVQDQIATIRAENDLTQRRLAEREASLSQLESEVRRHLDDALAITQREIEGAGQRADRSFRLLNSLVLAEQQVRAHNHASALNILHDAFKLEPDNYAINYLLGYLYSLRREYDRAIQHLEDSLAREAGFAPAIAALGLALRRKGDSLGAEDERTQRNVYWSQAEMRLLNALQLDPHLTDAEGESYYGSLAGLYRRQGRYADAIDAYRRAEQITPTSSYPLINLASLYWHQGATEQAHSYFERVHDVARLKLDTNPLDNWARADFAQALAALGQRDEALRQFEFVRENHPEEGLLLTIRSGLAFLAPAPVPNEGIGALLAAVDRALVDLPATATTPP
ncbi:MAG: tetratricopeptide repeat protein [Anaerolineae bacterium]|nr:tetratricopeptide repeat protein [Anaerolineae bacterium]